MDYKTQFQKRVFLVAKTIPKGKFMTYGEVAKILKTSPRAVGQALKRNRNKEVPCHRVIKSDGSLGGFSGNIKKNIVKKKRILISEGVRFKDGKAIK